MTTFFRILSYQHCNNIAGTIANSRALNVHTLLHLSAVSAAQRQYRHDGHDCNPAASNSVLLAGNVAAVAAVVFFFEKKKIVYVQKWPRQCRGSRRGFFFLIVYVQKWPRQCPSSTL
jgi:hypothetical protein